MSKNKLIKKCLYGTNMRSYSKSPTIINGFDGESTKWKALNNIDFKVIPDSTFTRDKTGAGSIEYFQKEHPEGITYPNGYRKPHPSPGNDVILYNPKENDELDIRLDALHIMPKDATYDALNTIYREAAKNSDVTWNAKHRYDEDVKNHGKENLDSFIQYFNNEADGLLRNMFIEGTPEYIASKRYYPDKAQLREWNKRILPEIDAIQQYLETGERPQYILPEVVITPDKKKCGGRLIPKHAKGNPINNPLPQRLLNDSQSSIKTFSEVGLDDFGNEANNYYNTSLRTTPQNDSIWSISALHNGNEMDKVIIRDGVTGLYSYDGMDLNGDINAAENVNREDIPPYLQNYMKGNANDMLSALRSALSTSK